MSTKIVLWRSNEAKSVYKYLQIWWPPRPNNIVTLTNIFSPPLLSPLVVPSSTVKCQAEPFACVNATLNNWIISSSTSTFDYYQAVWPIAQPATTSEETIKERKRQNDRSKKYTQLPTFTCTTPPPSALSLFLFIFLTSVWLFFLLWTFSITGYIIADSSVEPNLQFLLYSWLRLLVAGANVTG